MCPKLICEGDFTNPITGELQTAEMTIAVTREHLEQLTNTGREIVFADLEKIAQDEYDNSNAQYQYKMIKEYAKEHNYMETELKPDILWKHIQSVTDLAETPKVVLDVHIVHELQPELDARITDERTIEDTSGPFYLYSDAVVNGKLVRIFVHSYAPWSERDCLVYDENNPKNSKLISFIQ